MPFLELLNGVPYEFYQINGTKYYRNYNSCPAAVKEQLEQCAGEIYLSRIPPHATADQFATIASSLGELYVLRFKINFAGESRGFAYLQYMDPNIFFYAVKNLPKLFSANGFGNVRAKRSKNTSHLVLRHSDPDMRPHEVLDKLTQLCNYVREFNMRPVKDGQIDYQLVFGSNEDAVKARRILIAHSWAFGNSATIGWDPKK